MRTRHGPGLSSGLSSRDRAKLAAIQEFWQNLEDPGAESWEVLDDLRQQVSECLYWKPPDIAKAESLTAQAMLLRKGGNGL